MARTKTTRQLKDLLTNITRTVAYSPELACSIGDVKAALLFCQLCHWYGRGAEGDGWFYKSANEIEKETGLTTKEQAHAREVLRNNGLLQERKKGMPCHVHFLLNLDAAEALIAKRPEKALRSRNKEKAPQKSGGSTVDKTPHSPGVFDSTVSTNSRLSLH